MAENIRDQSGDKKYFTVVPRIVMALCRSPYEYTLWCAIKDVAGEEGECYVSTENLAAIAMMSVGMVSQCRAYLMQVGLINGEMKKVDSGGQPVWHLTVPDLWKQNIEWCERYPKISDRASYKEQQKDQSDHDMKRFCEKLSHDESKASPGELKKNIKEEPLINTASPGENDFIPAVNTSNDQYPAGDNTKSARDDWDPENPELWFDAQSTQHCARDKLTPQEYKDRVLRAVHRGADVDYQIKEKIHDLFAINPNWDRKDWKKFSLWAKTLPPDQSLDQFARWWKERDWRGKQGQPPNAEQIMELWPQAFADTQPVKRYDHGSVAAPEEIENEDGSLYV